LIEQVQWCLCLAVFNVAGMDFSRQHCSTADPRRARV
jgi:hypothetical protein